MTKELEEGWKEFELGEILNYEQPGDYIIDSEDYSDDNKTPVLTAGKSFILGYTNETKGIYNKLPVIIFDDFTTSSHYVDFPFKIKSSAMKLLTPKMDNINLKFVFCMMKGLHHNTITHKRYWISEFQPKKIPIPIKEDGTPDMKKQEKIIKFIEKAEKAKEWRKKADDLTKDFLKSVFLEMFGDPVKNPKKYGIKKLNDICDVRDGTHDSPKYVNEGYPLITSKNLANGFIDFSEVNLISKKDFDLVNKRSFVDDGDIIMPMIGTIGHPIIVKKEKEFAIKNVALIKFTKTDVSNVFIKFLLDSHYFDYINLKNNRGGTQKFISLGDIRKFPIPLPPISLQNKFASIVKEVEAMKEQQKHSKNQIDNLFNALMQKAFKGEIKC